MTEIIEQTRTAQPAGREQDSRKPEAQARQENPAKPAARAVAPSPYRIDVC